MADEIRDLYQRLKRTPFPELGKRVGHFPLWDSFVAGCASRAARGETVAASEVPLSDDETAAYIGELKSKRDLTPDERAFLEYAVLLETICDVMRRR